MSEMSYLSGNNLETVTAWGGASHSMSYVYRPSTVADLEGVFALARHTDRTIIFRGGGNSYGDAFSNREHIVLDLARLNRILDWQAERGVIRVEPGVTIEQLWRYVLGDGWWPPIVTGTSKTTVGGCAAMNAHGKNGWQMGTFGDHILAFELLLANGETISCSREENADLFFAAIGGFGMLGCFTSITMQLKRIYSGYLRVEGATRPNLARTLAYFDETVAESDYVVGWIDAFAQGRSLGRSEMHRAHYVQPENEVNGVQSLRLENQAMGDSYLGLLPKSSMWFFMRPFFNNVGVRLMNMVKYQLARFSSGEDGHLYNQSHTAFHFLLDYIPNWKRSYGRGGLIQYQSFIPYDQAESGFRELIELGHRFRMPNYLTVIKRHRPDPFLISYGLDGYSLAMDFPVSAHNRQRLIDLTRQMDEVVLRHDGRFYLAKDSTLRPEVLHRYLGGEALGRFWALKRRCDPNLRLQSDLWRRGFMPLLHKHGADLSHRLVEAREETMLTG